MSENILIGKNRKTGKWEILVYPSESYDAHLKAYQKIARNLPVNDNYSRVLLGRVQNTSSPLTLVTTDEKASRDKSLNESVNVAANAGKDAEERQKKLAAQQAADADERHDAILDEKNAMINKLRKATGQPVCDETKTEKYQAELAERLKTPAKAEKKADESLAKSKEEELAEKNKLTDEVKQQAGNAPAKK